MNTLQLYISKSSRDNVRLAEINPTDEGRRAAVDMKAAVSMVDYAPSAKMAFFIVVNMPGGYAIHVIRTIPPTRPNHLDATVYIDKNLDVMAEDLEEVLSRVTDIVLAKAVTEKEMAELNRLFGREYDLCDKAPRIKSSRGKDIALLQYGDNSGRSLGDILNEGIYRAEWSGYKAVVLLDDSVSTLGNSMVNLDDPEEEPDADEDGPDDDGNAVTQRKAASKSRSYIFSLPISTPDGRTALEFEVESSKPMTHSPVAGFVISGRPQTGPDAVNRLHKGNSRQTAANVLWGIAGLALGMLVMFIAGLLSDGPGSAGPQDSYVEAPTAEQADVSKATEATAYLDNNRIWNRDDMENIDGLAGLFDDMNNYRFEIITDKWASSLGASKNFAKVIRAANDAINKNSDPRRAADHNPTYNREGDYAISWRGYTYWIDP